MNTDYIHYFLTVVQYGSINKAAEKLNINNQHLGRIIKSLETEVGGKLIERDFTGVHLTSDGMDVLELMHTIDNSVAQLKYHFSINETLPFISNYRINFYSTITINNVFTNNLSRKIQKVIPNSFIEITEASANQIIKLMQNDEFPAYSTLLSFDDYPSLCINSEFIPNEIEVLDFPKTSYAKLVMLTSVNNPISDKYKSISIENLIKKPLIFYSPYDLEENHFYQLLQLYGTPNIKYKTTNLQSFYDLLKHTECIAVGACIDNAAISFNPIFSKEQQLCMIPIRENIQARVISAVNKKLSNDMKENSILRNIIMTS